MKTRLKLPSGVTGFYWDDGTWQATGSQMGRRNILSDNRDEPIKLKMERLRLVDGDYDQWGAYWGYTRGTSIYCAWTGTEEGCYVFVRAKNREEAKRLVRESLPNVTFYR